jgi:valyl-tRNA synthetase
MDKTYQPNAIETSLYARWEASGAFTPQGQGEPYCIVIPPPNVTGTLHMGHAFQDTIMDALIRYHRMQGNHTLWQPGTDHAGIATQMVVERQLNAEGKNRHELGRSAFIDKVWQWKEVSGNTISSQMRRLGASCDWQRERFTMDPGLSQAVTEAFVRLYRDGLIYRGKRLVNWDPVLHTALSDLEVLAEPEAGHLWHLRYPVVDSSEVLVVATTRPETLFGDTAVAVHPEDERFQHLIGKSVELPLCQRRIPIIADAFVDREFGSGCVKVTPAHDFNDYDVGLRHALPMINILDRDAKLNEQVPSEFRGLHAEAARLPVIERLSALGLIERIDAHQRMTPRGDRSGAVIEPWLTDQWYVAIERLAKPAIAAVAAGQIRFVPEAWDRTYFEWMKNIKDWCISRQLWWGHRIPAWYDPDGKIYVGQSESAVRAHYHLDAAHVLTQDEDVLDTWFSSALWPFSTMGWPNNTAELQRFYPTSVLVTGFDIIFFWVARMIMFGLYFTGKVPFREVYVHGLIRDAQGQKMSKSKGNVIDPIDLIDGIDLETLVRKRTTGLMQPKLKNAIEKATRSQFPTGLAAYGTDALRITFASLATLSRDIRFDVGRIEGYRNFCNKLWNGSRFVLLATESDPGTGPLTLSNADHWIKWRLAQALLATEKAIGQYRFDLATQALYDFAWYDFCDNYLELTKAVLQADTATLEERRGTRQTLLETLDALLRALHPLMPFITEAIGERVRGIVAPAQTSVMHSSWPSKPQYDQAAATVMAWNLEIVYAVRKIRGVMDIPGAKPLTLILDGLSDEQRDWLNQAQRFVKKLANVSQLLELKTLDHEPVSAIEVKDNVRLLVPMAGLIDPQAETARVGKKLLKLATDLDKLQHKLSNERFVANAPAEIVAEDRERVRLLQQETADLQRHLSQLQRLTA